MNAWLRVPLRRLRRQWPSVLFVWGLTSVGIAVFVALTTVIDAVLIREPFPGAEDLVVFARPPRADVARGRTVDEVRLDDVNVARLESGLAVAAVGSLDRSGPAPGDPIRTRVSTNFFDVLAARAILGRTFVDADRDALDIAVIGETLWRSAYGGDQGVIGRTVTLGQSRLTIIGVVAAEVTFPAGTNLWTPLDRTSPVPFTYRAIARIPPSSSTTQLAARLRDWRVIPLREQLYPADASHILVFLGAGGLLLAIIWIHVALVLATDAVRRLGEFRLRLALGAGMRRVTLTVLAEAGLLVAACVAVGAALTPTALAWLMTQLPPLLFAGRSVAMDEGAAVVLLGVLAIGVVATISATLPVIAVLRRTNLSVAGSGARTARNLTRSTRWIAALQFAAATPVLYLMGLATMSFNALVRTDLGIDVDHVLAVQLPVMASRREESVLARRLVQLQRLFDETQVTPGVESVGFAQDRLGSRLRFSRSVWLPGSGQSQAVQSESSSVSGAYFDLLRIPVLSGGVFEARPGPPDRGNRRLRRVIVDETLAAHLADGADLLGRDILIGGIPARVIAVVGAIRPRKPDEVPHPRYYEDIAERPDVNNLLVRFAGDHGPVQGALSRLVQDVFSMPAPAQTILLSEELSRLQADYRGRFHLMSITGWIAGALTAAGVFGIGAYLVTRRRAELAVRMALGATRRNILWVCLRELAIASVVGASVGLLAGVLLGRQVASMFYVVTPADPLVLASLLGTLVIIGLGGVTFPARRAWRTDVSAVLRMSE